MSTPEDAVRLLGALGETDRRWMLDRLSMSARARLAEHVDGGRAGSELAAEPTSSRNEPTIQAEAGAGAHDEFDWRRSIAQLSAAAPTSLVRALESEPAWIVHAVLSATDWPWRREVRKDLSPALRAELSMLERTSTRLALPAVRVLVRELAMRAPEWPPAPPRAGGLRALIARLRGEALT